jgi:acyl-CoA hydrolase
MKSVGGSYLASSTEKRKKIGELIAVRALIAETSRTSIMLEIFAVMNDAQVVVFK